MRGVGPAEAWLFLKRDPAPPGAATLDPAAHVSTDAGERGYLACARCLAQITTPSARIAVAGSHEHSFRNPEGIQYRIGCFASVTGCLAAGPRSTYWTWFAGHTWQVALCGACRAHLGWQFRSSDRRFHGLILDRLVELEAGSGRA
jgi:hypothetical protein